MKLHVITNKEALLTEELTDKVVVVFDVLLATTTIVSALHLGAESVIPVMDVQEARRIETEMEEEVLLSGEWNGRTIEGFLAPSPFILKDQLKGKHLILSSTNGTRAIRRAFGAKTLYAGSLLNATALTDWLFEAHFDETILLVCAGSSGELSLEDFLGAGIFTVLLKEKYPNIDLTDAATAAYYFAAPQMGHTLSILMGSRVGKMMIKYGMEQEVRLASEIGSHQEIPILVNNQLKRKVAGSLLSEI